MFKFDSILFDKAFEEITKAIDDLESIDLSCDKDCVDDYCLDLWSILNQVIDSRNYVKELKDDVDYTRCICFLTNYDFGDFYKEKYYSDFENADRNAVFLLRDMITSGLICANQANPENIYHWVTEGRYPVPDLVMKKYNDMCTVLNNYYATIGGMTANRTTAGHLYALQSGGCGLSAISNILIDYYSKLPNGEELFLKKFGFPLYYIGEEDGLRYYNYEPLQTQVYVDCLELSSHTMDFGREGNKGIGNLFGSTYSPFLMSFMVGEGTSYQQRNDLLLPKEFEGIPLSVDNKDISMSSLQTEQFEQHDYMFINVVQNFVLKSINGKEYTFDGNHTMQVIGITEDGKYIVNSWSNLYILDSFKTADITLIDVGDKNE